MDYLLQVNYLLPVSKAYLTQEDIEYAKSELENILTQQIIISQLSKGISFEDTNNMDSYERVFIFKKLVEMEKEKTEAKMKAIEDMKGNK